MAKLRLFSPAKVNLFLRLLGRRQDGYHELSSLFQTVSLGDTLDFELQNHDALTCSDPSIPLDGSNLILKATRLFRQKTGLTAGLQIHLDKKIPIEAGLGGGSSNAATTLWAFNQLLGSPATSEQLIQWAQEIGSDVPFFFSQGTAHCTGRGEVVNLLPSLPAHRPFWIVKPAMGSSTVEIYRKVKLDRLMSVSKPPCKELLAQFFAGNYNCFNDLEHPACEANSELLAIKQQLVDSGFEIVTLTGSGSAFLCFGPTHPTVKKGMSTYSVSFLNRNGNQWYEHV